MLRMLEVVYQLTAQCVMEILAYKLFQDRHLTLVTPNRTPLNIVAEAIQVR